MLPVVELSFDAAFRLGDAAVRWQTVGLTVASLAALGIALSGIRSSRPPLRIDDLAYVALASVPGAIVGGRLLHAAAHLETYLTDPFALLDPGRGSLSLLGAALGGTVSAGYIGRLLSGSVRPWAELAAVPLLVAIGLGKVGQLLGGGGQGTSSDLPWAVAFGGAGPWLSVAPEVPSHPSQLYEGVWALLGVAVVVLVARRSPAVVQAWTALPLAFGWWLTGRVAIGFTWRDDRLLGILNVEQLAAVLVLLGGAGLIAMASRRRRSAKPLGAER